MAAFPLNQLSRHRSTFSLFPFSARRRRRVFAVTCGTHVVCRYVDRPLQPTAYIYMREAIYWTGTRYDWSHSDDLWSAGQGPMDCQAWGSTRDSCRLINKLPTHTAQNRKQEQTRSEIQYIGRYIRQGLFPFFFFFYSKGHNLCHDLHTGRVGPLALLYPFV